MTWNEQNHRPGASSDTVADKMRAVPASTPPATARLLTGDLTCYARSVAGTEWDAQAKGELGDNVNPWGLAMSASSPFWISNNHSGISTVYNGAGQPFPAASPLVVQVSAPVAEAPAPAAPGTETAEPEVIGRQAKEEEGEEEK